MIRRLLLASLPLLLLACTTTTPPGITTLQTPVETPQLSEASQQALDEAELLLIDARYADAGDAFAQIAADPATDPDAAAIARIFGAFSQLQRGDAPAPRAALLEAAQDSALPAATQRLAAILLGLHRAEAGERDDALRQLHDLHPEGAPSPLLAPQLGQDALPILAEAHARHGAPAEALNALSWLFQIAPQTPELQRYAVARALPIARRELSAAQLDALADADDDLLSGVAIAALLLNAPAPPPPEQADRLAALAERAEATLLRLGEPMLAQEVSLRAAARSPRQRIVGALLPLSGPDRSVGLSALRGLLLAQSAFRDDASPRLTLAVYDTRSTPEGARAGVAYLADQGASLLIGPLSNVEARAAAEDARARRLPLIALSIDPSLADGPRGTFRLFVDSRREVDALLKRAEGAGTRRLAVLYPDVPFGRELHALAVQQAPARGVEIVAALPYDPAKPDFGALATKVARAHPDALFVPDVASRVALLLPFLAVEHLWCTPPGAPAPAAPTDGSPPRLPLTCLGNVTWRDPTLLRDGSSYLQGATIAASWAPEADTPENARFLREHRALIGGEPDVFAAFAWEALRLARRAILQRGLDTPARLLEGLPDLPAGDGLTGPLQVLPSGEVGAPPVVLEVRGERLQRVAP